MPNRIIKESICTSENINQLTEFQEVFFYRLMVNCDDFGRFDARPKLLSSMLFPLRDVRTEDIERALEALQDADLITVYKVDGHPYLYMNKWGKHQTPRANKSRFPDPDTTTKDCMQEDSSENTCMQLHADESNGMQTDTDASECSRIRIRNRIRIRESDSVSDACEISDAEAKEIQGEHNRILDAAEDAGFKMGNSVRAALIKMYSEYGLQKVLDGIASCVKHGAPNLAYLEACMKDKPKPSGGKVLNAQNFQQRDYSSVDDELKQKLAEEMAAFKESQRAVSG